MTISQKSKHLKPTDSQVVNVFLQQTTRFDLNIVIHVLSFFLVVSPTKSIKLLCTSNLLFGLLPNIHCPKVFDFFLKLMDPSDPFYGLEGSLFNVFWKYMEATGMLHQMALVALDPFSKLKTTNFTQEFKGAEIRKMTSSLTQTDKKFKHPSLRFFFKSLIQNGEIALETPEEINKFSLDVDLVGQFFIKEPLPAFEAERKKSPANANQNKAQKPKTFLRTKTQKHKTTVLKGGLISMNKLGSKQEEDQPVEKVQRNFNVPVEMQENPNFKVIYTKNLDPDELLPKRRSSEAILQKEPKLQKTFAPIHQVLKGLYKFYPDDLRFANSLEPELSKLSMESDKEMKADHISRPLMELFKNIIQGGLTLKEKDKLREGLNCPLQEVKWFWDAIYKKKTENFFDAIFKNYLCKIQHSILISDSCSSGFISGELLNLLLANRSFNIEIIFHTKSINQICLQKLPLFHYTLKRCFEVLDQFDPRVKKSLIPFATQPTKGRGLLPPLGTSPNLRNMTEAKEAEKPKNEQLGVFRILLAETLVLLLETKGTASVRNQIIQSTKDTTLDIMVHWFFCFK